MNLHTYTLFLALMLCTINQVFGQVQPELQVFVKDGESYLEGVTIEVFSDQKNYTGKTERSGRYAITAIEPDTYIILAHATGYIPVRDTVTIGEKQWVIRELVLYRETTDISEISVVGKTETQQVREQAVRAVVVDTRAVAEQPTTLAELMNRASGIRIRQSGGLGSQADISMNGFQGRAVRYFKDGVPLNYLGDGFSLNNVSIDMLERVEVYKGALPIELGADALGGAVNMVTRRPQSNRLALSYELASFNTHRLSLNTYITDRSQRLYGGADVFFNYSDNNYTAHLMVTDPETRNQVERPIELFHNAYKNYYAEGYIGLRDRSWAKDLRLSLTHFHTDRQQQHPALMTDPYGALRSTQSSLIPTLRYRHSLFDERLDVEQFVVMNTLNAGVIDTVRGYYDWYGTFYPNANRIGESGRPSLSDVDIQQVVSRTLVRFHVNEQSTISANFVYTDTERKGQDPYGPRFDGTDVDVLSVPATYRKSVAALGWESSFMDKRLSYNLMGKWYNYTSKGVETWAARPANLDETVTASQNNYGMATGWKYQVDADLFARMSAEYAYRLPDFNELFGDAVWIVPSFRLKPERSLNVNAGAVVQKEKYGVEVNGFYRQTQDLILLVTNIPPYSQYRNIDNVRGYGIEMDGRWELNSYLRATANATWQSLRLYGFTTPGDLWRNGTRLQNTPYFFANVGLVSSVRPNILAGDFLQLYANYNFVREFYLQTIARESEPGGFLGLGGSANVNSAVIIPNQSLVSAGATYRPMQDKLAISIESKNILNERQYDFFRVQRAGRSFHLKLTYVIN